MTVYWPNGSLTRPHVTSDYDPARKNPVTGIVQAHNGIDLIGWTDNCSPVDGTVVFAGYNGGAGNEVRIRADGPTAFHVGDYYRILHHASLYVRTGDRVKARQPVGRMGTTGQSTGVHCHFETHEWRLWNPVNPTDYMNRANAGTPAGGGSKPLDPPAPPKRKKRKMIHAAYRATNGTFAVQYRPRGRLTLLPGGTGAVEMAGMSAAQGVEMAQISDAQLQALIDLYGVAPYAAADTAHLPFLIVRGDPSGTVYTFAGGKLEPIYDPKTLETIEYRAESVVWSAEEIRLRRANA